MGRVGIQRYQPKFWWLSISTWQCDETLHCAHCAHCTTSRRERQVTGRFAPSSVGPIGCIQRFLLIQLKPSMYFGAVHLVRCFVTPVAGTQLNKQQFTTAKVLVGQSWKANDTLPGASWSGELALGRIDWFIPAYHVTCP